MKIKRMSKREARAILRVKLNTIAHLDAVMQEKASALAQAREQVKRERAGLTEFMRTVNRMGAL